MIALHGKITLTVSPKPFSRNISVMNKLKHFVPTRILHVLYCTLVLPYLSGVIHANRIWTNLLNFKNRPLELFPKVTTEVIQDQFLPNTMF